jgi:calcineurin-like phosphoesterase family protein
MSETYFTSDMHFGHANIIKYCNRPFSSVGEMNEGLVKRHNTIVTPEDTVYYLGDMCFGEFDLTRLNGRKVLIIGNHDPLSLVSKYFKESYHYLELKGILPKQRALQLFHYPIESWNGKFHGSIHLHGHSHGTCDNTGLLRFDVGVDCWDMSPVHIDQILELVPKRKEEAEAYEQIRRDEAFKKLNELADKDAS